MVTQTLGQPASSLESAERPAEQGRHAIEGHQNGVAQTVERRGNASPRTAQATGNGDAGFFGSLARGLSALSFQLYLTGPSGQSYRQSRASSTKEKALLDALWIGIIQ